MVTLVVPGILFSSVSKLPLQPVAPSEGMQSAVTVPNAQIPQNKIMIAVLQKDGGILDMELEEYVCGVVLGEMPASFETEALKAQAVAARTYALRCASDGVHKQNAVCKDHTCCQNYCDPWGYLQSGGSQTNLDKITEAVEQTRGQVATFNGRLIFATYFASSGGSTEDAVAVWGNSFPYLVAVDSPNEGDTGYQNYKVTFSAKSFQSKLGVTLSGTPKTWFGKITRTEGGGVAKITIGGKNYTGVKLRNLLGLRSTNFTVSATDSAVTFTTNGYGHRVGMSQYGADAMAAAGADYKQILTHYYTGIVLETYPLKRD